MITIKRSRIKELQNELNISRDQLSSLIGVSTRTLNGWGEGEGNINIGNSKGQQRLIDLINVMDHPSTRNEIRELLAEFSGEEKSFGVAIVRNMLRTLAMIVNTKDEEMRQHLTNKIISILYNVKNYNKQKTS